MRRDSEVLILGAIPVLPVALVALWTILTNEIEELETLPAGTEPRASDQRSPAGERLRMMYLFIEGL